MAIRFRCNKCGSKITVKDEMAGKGVKCPDHGGVITVPVPAEEDEEDTPPPNRSPAATTKKAAPPA